MFLCNMGGILSLMLIVVFARQAHDHNSRSFPSRSHFKMHGDSIGRIDTIGWYWYFCINIMIFDAFVMDTHQKITANDKTNVSLLCELVMENQYPDGEIHESKTSC